MATLTDPEQLGLKPRVLDDLVTQTHRQCVLGGLNSCQIAVARHGRLALFTTVGEALADDSRYAIYSVSKPLLASAFWLVMSEWGVDVACPVVEFVPEFGDNGKEGVTIEQLLTHTAGFPNAVLGPPHWSTRAQRLQTMAEWTLAWAPGSQCQYHPTSSYWVLAEIVERITGVDYREFIATRITGPLALDGFQLGVPGVEQGDINQVRSVGQVASAEEMGAFFGEHASAPENADHRLLLLMNDPEVRALGVPGGGGVANAADVALFYQALLHNPAGLWDNSVLADALTNIRVDLPDPFSGLPANRTLGLIVQGGDGQGGRRGMGAVHTSPQCFGHHGAGGQVAWADPQTGVSFCFLTDSLDAHAVRVARRGPLLSDLAALSAL